MTDPEIQILIQRVASEAADKAVGDVLLRLGLDPANPLEVQRDMAALRELRSLMTDPEFQKDMMHIRKWRVAMESVTKRGLLTFVALIVAGTCAAVVVGMKGVIGSS